MELPSGGAMMISGLLQQQTKQDLDSMPAWPTCRSSAPCSARATTCRARLNWPSSSRPTPYLVKPTSPDQLQTPGRRAADRRRPVHRPARQAQQGRQGRSRRRSRQDHAGALWLHH
ncbi:MAG: hypothetical protein WDN45_14940 [Caulobacteraceae bacterium]